jgi:hypothetical protein
MAWLLYCACFGFDLLSVRCFSKFDESATTQAMEEAPTSCANCGKAEELDAKLKTCNACKLVKYCGSECQIAHRPEHKRGCMERAAEFQLHDEELFKQPPKGDDCPICFLLLPAMGSGESLQAMLW